MQLTVKLFATFRTGRFEVAELEAAPGLVELDHQPSPGDTVSIFPKVGGG